MSERETAKRRGRWLRRAAVAVVVLAAIVALLPMLVSATIARSIVAGAVADQVNGTVSVSRVSFGWLGPQRLEGLRIDDRAGGNRIEATVEVRRSLFSLITSPLGDYDIVARAAVETTMAPDGTLGLSTLAKPSPAPRPGTPSPGGPGAHPGAPSQPPSSLVASITLEPSSLLIDRGADGTIKLTNLAGSTRVAFATGAIDADLKGTLEGDGRSGPVTLQASLTNAIDPSGSFVVGSMVGSATASVDAFGMRWGGVANAMRGLSLVVDATNASAPIIASVALTEATHGETDLRDLAGEARLGRDPRGPAGISISAVEGSITRGSITVRGGEEPFSAKDLRAHASLGAGGALNFKLSADTTIGARTGSVAGEGSFTGLFDESFKPTLAASSGSASLRVTRAVVPAGPVQLEIGRLAVEIDARDASAPISLHADGQGMARTIAEGGSTPGTGDPVTLAAALKVARDATSAFGVSTDPRRVSGSVEAKSIPTGVLRPFVPDLSPLDLDPVRDLGPVVDLTVNAPGGAAAPLSVAVRSARVNASVEASVEAATGSVQNANAVIDATLAPEVLRKTDVRAEGPLAVSLRAAGVSLPRRGDEFDLASVSAREVRIGVDGTLLVRGGDSPITISAVQASASSSRLGDGARIQAATTIDGIAVSATADLTGLGSIGTAAFSTRSITGKGTLHAGPINWHVPPPMLAAAPTQLVDLGLSASAVTLAFDGSVERGRGQVTVVDGSQGLASSLEWSPTSVRVSDTAVTAVLTDRSLDALSLPMFRLQQPATVKVTLSPVELQRAAIEAGRVELPPAGFTVAAGRIALAKAPGVAQPIILTSLVAEGTVDLAKDVAVTLKGATGVSDATSPIASTEFGFSGERLAVASRSWNASVDAKQLDGVRLLTVSGIDPAKVPGISATDRGNAAVRVRSGDRGALAADFDAMIGALRGKGSASLADDGGVTIPGADLSITLDAARATAFFAEEKDERGRPLITRASALPITVSLTDFTIPAASGSLQPLRSAGKARLTTGNLDLELASIGPVRIGAIDAEAALAGGGRSALVRANSTITARGGSASPLAFRAVASDFLDPQGRLDIARMSLEGEVQMDGLPIALLDLFVDGDGLLVDMLGPELAANLRATSPSGAPGSVIVGTMNSRYMQTDLGGISLERGLATITGRAPLTMALVPNKTLRQRLLKPINPILEDIRPREEKPIVFAVNELSLPTDLDLHRFDADFTLTVGEVEIERSDSMLNLLKLVRDDADGLIDGEIGPLRGTIREGRLSYENFIISFGRVGQSWNQQLFFSGDVDLASKPPYATAINVDYPITGIGRLATGATRFDAFFGRVNMLLDRLPIVDLNALRVRATFHGPIEPDRDLDLAFEPVIVGTDGRPMDLGTLLTRLPGQIIDTIIGGGSKPDGGGTDQPSSDRPRDPIRGILDDIFKKR